MFDGTNCNDKPICSSNYIVRVCVGFIILTCPPIYTVPMPPGETSSATAVVANYETEIHIANASRRFGHARSHNEPAGKKICKPAHQTACNQERKSSLGSDNFTLLVIQQSGNISREHASTA